MTDGVRQHPTLGELRWNPTLDSWEATVELFPGCHIRFAIVAEAEWADIDPAELFEIGATFLQWAREFEPHCRDQIANDLLDCYNEVWADEDPEEGQPPHTRGEFLSAIRPSGISLFDNGSSSWSYDPGDLFAGHSIWHMLDENRSFIGKASLVG